MEPLFQACLLALSSGMAFAWSSPMLPRLNGERDPDNNPLGNPITPSQESWLTGLLSLGAAIGPIPSGRLIDSIGRKNTLLLLSVPITLSYITFAFAKSITVYYIARLGLGISIGGMFTVLPIYLNEISTDKNRGQIGSLLNLFLVSGFVVVYSTGPFLTMQMFNLLCTIPLIFFAIVFAIFIPESPIYYITHNKFTKAENALRFLRNESKTNMQEELDRMQISSGGNSKKKAFKELFTTNFLLRGLKISCGLILFQQCAGINVVLGYLQSIFTASSSAIPSDIAPIIIAIIQVIAGIFTSVVVDKLTRRSLLMISGSVTACSLFLLGTYFSFQTNGYNVSSFTWLPLVSLITYIISFNIGIGPLPSIFVGELFPQDARSMASMITFSICYTTSFILTFLFPIITDDFGMATSFWILSSLCILGIVFVFMYVPETKGKTLQEIKLLLSQ